MLTDVEHIVLLCVACCALVVAVYCLVVVRRIDRRSRKLYRIIIARVLRGGEFIDTEGVTIDDEFAGEPYRPYESNDDQFLQRLEELIQANLGNHDLNVDFLATEMMVSRSLLFNRVRRATGKGIVEYVNGLRIERATEMFADEHRSLTEIAELTGFSTLRYFSRVFKSVKGDIPSTYRERVLAEKRRKKA